MYMCRADVIRPSFYNLILSRNSHLLLISQSIFFFFFFFFGGEGGRFSAKVYSANASVFFFCFHWPFLLDMYVRYLIFIFTRKV